MNEEPKLIKSPLSQPITSVGNTVSVEIYRLENETSWTLEIEDKYGNSSVWNETFNTDSEALVEAKRTILAEGINSLIGPEDGKSKGDWK
ncbi:hypothetical protein [Pelovirga terrestris]|uniref:Uncharacterized protein n=1 Tax=Pelovirga terrestris TaxID=2771352 RepID=A0A8J6QLE0_9BACT|nr:hypothetical protein [Pelovirga terrestris]MBD1400459.1 hypothetical protein [Pelovirga terrestris]